MESVQSLIRPELLALPTEYFDALQAYFIMIVGSVITLFLSMIRHKYAKWIVFGAACLTLAFSICSTLTGFSPDSVFVFNQMLDIDGYVRFFNLVFLICGLVTLFVSVKYLDREELQHPDYTLLVMFSVIGMMLMVAALDFITVFISLEIMSLSVYCLVGFRRSDRRSNEAALKYFILGGAASAIMLYGVALLYGATMTTNMKDILEMVKANGLASSPLLSLGIWLVFAGFLFKVATVPFHMWMPDVYEGAPAPITGFMTTALKAAVFASLLRVFHYMGFGQGLDQTIQTALHHILWISAVLTMVIGNVIALTQTNLKRMLAYSSIAHTGYLLLGFLAGPNSPDGYPALLVYLVSYAVMNIGAFGILSIIASKGDQGLSLFDLQGLSRKHPWLAFGMSVFLFSMAGIPPTAGFAAKWTLFYSAVQAGEVWITVIAVLCSAISVYYYLRVIVMMYMRDPVDEMGISVPRAPWAVFAVAAMVLLTLQVGIMPQAWISAAQWVIPGL